MLHVKYISSCNLEQEDLKKKSYINLCKTSDPSGGANDLNKLCRGPLENAKYQVSMV